MRTAIIDRKTNETNVHVELDLDGRGENQICTGVGFLDHMLCLFSAHSRFDLKVSCSGDTQIDDHHSVEDIGITLGKAFAQALGDKKGITRYGDAMIPMDESLILAAVDLSGRDYLNYDLSIPSEKIGSFDTELGKEFFLAFVRNSLITLHLKQLYGENSHHILEGAFKAFGRALRKAVAVDEKFSNEIPSTKGAL